MYTYRICTFGVPSDLPKRLFWGEDSKDRAIAAAQAAHGTGSCSSVRVYECDSRLLAISADISRVRPGERVIFSV